MHSRPVRQLTALLTLSLLPLACDGGSEGESSNPGTTSPTSTTSSANSGSGNTNATTAPGAVTSSNGATASASGNTSGGGSGGGSGGSATSGGSSGSGGTANSGGTAGETNATSDSDTTNGTTGGPPSGTPYVFTGSTNGSLRAFVMDPSDGSLTAAGSAETGQGLDFIALGPDNRTLFVARDSSLAAYSYDPTSESFTPKDEIETDGGGTYVNVDPTGGYVFVASYNEGLLSFFSYDSDAGFGDAATFGPGMNAHQVRVDASGRHVYVPCLGSNHVAQYDLDPGAGTLTESGAAPAAANGGPRHMTFHPSAPVAYVLTENSSQIHVYDVNEASGTLELRTDASSYTAEDEMRHWSSDIQITPDGSYVYAVNRDSPEIVRFQVREDHSLERLGSDELGAVVRAFAVDPAGGYLQIGGDDGNLVAYRIDPTSGSLSETANVPGLGDIHVSIVRYLE